MEDASPVQTAGRSCSCTCNRQLEDEPTRGEGPNGKERVQGVEEKMKSKEGRGRGSGRKGTEERVSERQGAEGSCGKVEGPGQHKARGRGNGKGLPAALLLLLLWRFEDRAVATAEAGSS